MKKIATYKCRAECSADAQAIRVVLAPWTINWREATYNEEYEGDWLISPDVEIELDIVEDGPLLGEMLWLIDQIGDCHVAAETLTSIENYTGKRTYYKNVELLAVRPSQNMVNQVLQQIENYPEWLDSQIDRMQDCLETFEEAI